MNQLFHHDNLDNRREVHRCLQLLHPRRAVAWLERQCHKAKGPHGSRPTPARTMAGRIREAEIHGGERHYRLATEIFFDWWMMATQYGIDMDQGAKELEEMTKRQR